MGYQGYTQCICTQGHYYEVDCSELDYICPQCGQEPAWCNIVDETNFSGDGIVPREILRAKYMWDDRFIPPTREETKLLRQKFDYDKYNYLVSLDRGEDPSE